MRFYNKEYTSQISKYDVIMFASLIYIVLIIWLVIELFR